MLMSQKSLFLTVVFIHQPVPSFIVNHWKHIKITQKHRHYVAYSVSDLIFCSRYAKAKWCQTRSLTFPTPQYAHLWHSDILLFFTICSDQKVQNQYLIQYAFKQILIHIREQQTRMLHPTDWYTVNKQLVIIHSPLCGYGIIIILTFSRRTHTQSDTEWHLTTKLCLACLRLRYATYIYIILASTFYVYLFPTKTNRYCLKGGVWPMSAAPRGETSH